MRVLVSIVLLTIAGPSAADSMLEWQADFETYRADLAKLRAAEDDLAATGKESELLHEQLTKMCSDFMGKSFEEMERMADSQPGTAAHILRCDAAFKDLSKRNAVLDDARDSILRRQGELSERYAALGRRLTALKPKGT